ncbi:lysosome membrane protein 2 isoform X3 [Alligator mississippiensis]|nr:lysosome membrane protein 2 isoform X3 [Alligator mississippiensis]
MGTAALDPFHGSTQPGGPSLRGGGSAGETRQPNRQEPAWARLLPRLRHTRRSVGGAEAARGARAAADRACASLAPPAAPGPPQAGSARPEAESAAPPCPARPSRRLVLPSPAPGAEEAGRRVRLLLPGPVPVPVPVPVPAPAMRTLCLSGVGGLSVCLLIASIALLAARVFQRVVDDKVEQETVLKNGTETFQVWENPPPPVYMQFYFFNLTNPLEVINGATPFVEEIGPYTYREYRPRVSVHILENGTKVSALNPKTYVFDPEKSIGDPEVDLIRTVNIPAVTAMEWAQTSPLHLPLQLILLYYREELFMTRTVHELLWGYKDSLLSTIHFFYPEVDSEFGLFNKMNGTDDGEYVFLSGSRNYLNFSRIVEWKGKKSLDWWTTKTCNMINGTDGNSFHPLISKDEKLYVFSSDFCRSLYLMFDSFRSVAGIPAYRFVPPEELFANTSVNPDNAGFCVPVGNCPGTGVLNVSICKQGTPIFLSSPHFYQADKKYINSIRGMNPKKEDHEMFLDVNPLTGVILQAAKRIQINIYIKKMPEFFDTGRIRTLLFPVVYINESVLIDEASASKLKYALFEATLLKNIPFVIMALGIIFGIVFIVLVCRFRGTKDEGREVLINSE